MTQAASKFEEDEARPPRIETLAVAELTLDGEIAPREIDPAIVAEYAERMAAGDVFPPVDVIRDGAVHYLFNGWQRVEAARQSGQASIACAIREGDRRAALLASTAANATHGVRRSIMDKRRAALKLLNDPEWSRWSAREIARQCRVSNTFVGSLRDELTVNVDSEGSGSDRVVQYARQGNVTTMDTSNIGATQKTYVTEVVRIPVKERPIRVETVLYRVPSPAEPRVVTITPPAPAFGEQEMAQLERLAQAARHADRALAPRLGKVAQSLSKTAQRLRTKQRRAKRRKPS